MFASQEGDKHANARLRISVVTHSTRNASHHRNEREIVGMRKSECYPSGTSIGMRRSLSHTHTLCLTEMITEHDSKVEHVANTYILLARTHTYSLSFHALSLTHTLCLTEVTTENDSTPNMLLTHTHTHDFRTHLYDSQVCVNMCEYV